MAMDSSLTEPLVAPSDHTPVTAAPGVHVEATADTTSTVIMGKDVDDDDAERESMTAPIQTRLEKKSCTVENETEEEAEADEMASLMARRLATLPGKAHESEPFTIFRVAGPMRERNRHLYEPQMVSIGPFHRGCRRLAAMEEHKWRYLRDLLSRNPDTPLASYACAARGRLRPRTRTTPRPRPVKDSGTGSASRPAQRARREAAAHREDGREEDRCSGSVSIPASSTRSVKHDGRVAPAVVIPTGDGCAMAGEPHCRGARWSGADDGWGASRWSCGNPSARQRQQAGCASRQLGLTTRSSLRRPEKLAAAGIRGRRGRAGQQASAGVCEKLADATVLLPEE